MGTYHRSTDEYLKYSPNWAWKYDYDNVTITYGDEEARKERKEREERLSKKLNDFFQVCR